MSGGLTAEEIKLIEDIFKKFWQSGFDAHVFLFGSRARETHRPFSDVDLLIEGIPLPKNALHLIAEALEESSLPYKVDLVMAHHLASGYAPSVHADKRLLFTLGGIEGYRQ
jgi:predicted nucleotidyltransferase